MVNIEIRLILFFEAKDGEALQSAEIRSGADCGSDHEVLIANSDLNYKISRIKMYVNNTTNSGRV